jgi:hypothetical protein
VRDASTKTGKYRQFVSIDRAEVSPANQSGHRFSLISVLSTTPTTKVLPKDIEGNLHGHRKGDIDSCGIDKRAPFSLISESGLSDSLSRVRNPARGIPFQLGQGFPGLIFC